MPTFTRLCRIDDLRSDFSINISMTNRALHETFALSF